MKRLLAIFFFLAGGLAIEVTHPVQCDLVTAIGTQLKRRKTAARVAR
ncbi:hypothetical protein [Burkholderia sp. Ac-20365]|nr:hypothetical protein [Burkholderia sp. Ac-20365]